MRDDEHRDAQTAENSDDGHFGGRSPHAPITISRVIHASRGLCIRNPHVVFNLVVSISALSHPSQNSETFLFFFRNGAFGFV